MPTMSRAELLHFKELLDNWEYIMELGDSTLFSYMDEERHAIVKQILQEKLDE